MEKDTAKAQPSLGAADSSAIDRVSGSPLALARAVWGILFFVLWLINNAGEIELAMLLMDIVSLFGAVGVMINYILARKGIAGDVGYTLHNISRATDALLFGMMTVAGLLIFGFETGLLIYVASVVNNIIVFRAYRAVQDSLKMNDEERKRRAYSQVLPVVCFVVSAVIYILCIYFVAVNGTGALVVRLLYCISLACRLGADVFTPILLVRYRRALIR